MTPTEKAFLEQARTAVLATIDDAGLPRLVPICFVVDAGGRVLSPIDEKPKAAADPHDVARVRDIAARPMVSLLVDRWSEDWTQLAWLRLYGRASLLEPGEPSHREAVEELRAKYAQYERHRLEDRPILAVEIDRARSWPTRLRSGEPRGSAP